MTNTKRVIPPVDSQVLMRVAQWIVNSNHRTVRMIRELAETEENYRIIIREHDRVERQISLAQKFRVEATLTLVDWLHTLEDFGWRCAYCQSQPFQVMSHVIPYPEGGMVLENCVPACYRCLRKRRSKSDIPAQIQTYFANRKNKSEPSQS